MLKLDGSFGKLIIYFFFTLFPAVGIPRWRRQRFSSRSFRTRTRSCAPIGKRENIISGKSASEQGPRLRVPRGLTGRSEQQIAKTSSYRFGGFLKFMARRKIVTRSYPVHPVYPSARARSFPRAPGFMKE